MEFVDCAIGFVLTKTTGSRKDRQKLLDYLKTFISNVDELHDCEISIKKRDIKAICPQFKMSASSSKQFAFGVLLKEDKYFETANEIMNNISEKLNEIEMKKAKSKIILVYSVTYSFDKKFNPLSKLINKEVFEAVSQKGLKIFPQTLKIVGDIEKEKDEDILLLIEFELKHDGNFVEFSLVQSFANSFPLDSVNSSRNYLNELLDTNLKLFVEQE